MFSFEKDDEGEQPLIEFHGVPHAQVSPGEKSKWNQFVEIFKIWRRVKGAAKKGSDLVENLSDAETGKRCAETEKFAAEAGEISARRDKQRQETVQFVNLELERIIDGNASDEVKAIQFANLMAANPQLKAELDKLGYKIERLHLLQGLDLEIAEQSKTEDAGG